MAESRPDGPEDDDALVPSDAARPEQVTGEIVPEQVERVAERAAELLMVRAAFFRGPLPSPETIAGYERALPGLADRCVRMAEKEQEFRHETKRSEQRDNNERAKDGQRFALAVAVLFLAGAVWVTLAGYPIVGGVLGTFDILGIVGIFVTGKYFSAREEDQRARAIAEAIRHQSDDDDDDE